MAAGIFAGGTIYKGKVFGRAIARGTAFGKSKTFAEAVAEARNSNNRIYLRLYAKIGSKVLINYHKTDLLAILIPKSCTALDLPS